ncbi:phosphoenolpyruvate carboxykinase (ATP) [Daejeonella sp.]|uniref:phosphoenolpyruvate carboxykinase (ATP) n=1 Tax=Daejeonella sp. TaxID=2805397 RepID=UPI00398364EE
MRRITINSEVPDLGYLELHAQEFFYQLSPGELTTIALDNNEGVISSLGALAVNTGKFTGRSPKDRFIVKDQLTSERVWWGDVNFPFSEQDFNKLYNKFITYLKDKTLFVRDGSVCSDENYRLGVRTITETAYQNLFAHNLFLDADSLGSENPEWTIIAAPGFMANPLYDGTRQENFSILNFTRRIVLIGGTGYTGEIKKAMFSVLNFLLPSQGVLPMHCAANKGQSGDTAIFFGLSGTGKTTLSADPHRELIGDDEHGWSDHSIFNFEGGCYAKTAGLTMEKEPQIYEAIKAGALLENIGFQQGSNVPDFNDLSITENTRVSYPMYHIQGAAVPSIGSVPENIIFLTADAFGVLPPVSKLSVSQAMYHFLSGYTSKIAGTEEGINDPQSTFSACFGKAFLPLHPVKYAELLGEKLRENTVGIWLINTGWTGGPYGIGERIKLLYTRNMIKAVLEGKLTYTSFQPDGVFGLMIPDNCPGVPSELLNPVNTWADPAEYFKKASTLAGLFSENFKQYEDFADDETKMSGPTKRTLKVSA